jgi:hypothetical protein
VRAHQHVAPDVHVAGGTSTPQRLLCLCRVAVADLHLPSSPSPASASASASSLSSSSSSSSSPSSVPTEAGRKRRAARHRPMVIHGQRVGRCTPSCRRSCALRANDTPRVRGPQPSHPSSPWPDRNGSYIVRTLDVAESGELVHHAVAIGGRKAVHGDGGAAAHAGSALPLRCPHGHLRDGHHQHMVPRAVRDGFHGVGGSQSGLRGSGRR